MKYTDEQRKNDCHIHETNSGSVSFAFAVCFIKLCVIAKFHNLERYDLEMQTKT